MDRGKGPQTIDEYIAGFRPETQAILESIRNAVRNAAPEAEEKISYGMPAFAQHGVLVYFAAHTHHIGFYPTSSGVAAFEGELSAYRRSKGAVQFPLDLPLPYDLIQKIVRFRVAENEKRAEARVKGTR